MPRMRFKSSTWPSFAGADFGSDFSVAWISVSTCAATDAAILSLMASESLAGIDIFGSTLESGEIGSIGLRPRVTLADAAAIAAAAAEAISATDRPWLTAATPVSADFCVLASLGWCCRGRSLVG